jgi:two-component system, chemotaxis family, response regulator Rcp1
MRRGGERARFYRPKCHAVLTSDPTRLVQKCIATAGQVAQKHLMIPISERGPLEVLLVEDSPGDVRLTQEAFRVAARSVRLHVATDGVEAMAFLRRNGAQAHAPRPDLILLDLNLPKMNGHEVLAEIKGDVSLKLIPTVILTMSMAPEDISRSYALQANCYLAKPVDVEAFETLVKSINDFWLAQAVLPRQMH